MNPANLLNLDGSARCNLLSPLTENHEFMEACGCRSLLIFVRQRQLFINVRRHSKYIKTGIKYRGSGILLLIIMVVSSCSSTKYVGEGEYLLQKNYINSEKGKELPFKELKTNLRQTPNKRIVGVRLRLGLYNLSKPEKEKGLSGWLKKIGEPPVVYEPTQTAKTVSLMNSYLQQKGFFNAAVSDSVWFVKKMAYVSYKVQFNQPYILNNIRFNLLDTALQSLISADTGKTMLKQGDNYSVETLNEERARIERDLKNHGFYTFQRTNVNFEADSMVGNKKIDLKVEISPRQVKIPGNGMKTESFRKYQLRNVYFFVDFSPADALRSPAAYYNNLDTTLYHDFYFIQKNKKSVLDYDVILRGSYINSGDLYNLKNVELTRRHLAGLNVINHVDIFFTPVEMKSGSLSELPLLDCHIQITPNKLQSYAVELEGTNSSGNFGASVNLVYQHRNLMKKAEVLNMKLKYAFEALPQEEKGFSSMNEAGAEANLVFPRFLLPFLQKGDFVKKFNPKTTFFTAYNYQQRPEYIRTMLTTSFGYLWHGNDFASHIVTPIDLNAIKLPFIDSAYAEHIDTTSYLAYSYKNTFIAGMSYSFIFTNQNVRKNQDTYYVRFNFSTSGNMFHLANHWFNDQFVSHGNEFLGIEYAQFVEGDIDLRYHTYINDANTVVYRGFLGVGFPYGNSKALPFAKQYYTGGANDIRAWPVRSLGPGSYNQANTNFYNQTADMKIVANLEYRFKMFWLLEGALFIDSGNIWAVSKEDDRTGALFNISSFYKDLAVGSGFGLRFDFTYFLFRLDLGVKIRDPQIQGGNKWVIAHPNYDLKNTTLHFAIGYPF